MSEPCTSLCSALIALQRRVQELSDTSPKVEGEDAEFRDVRWTCPKCGGLLGCFDTQRNEMRIKYKDLSVWIRMVGMTRVERICSKCGEKTAWPV